jgi:hypothetical protein
MEEIKTGIFKVNNNIPVYIIGDIHGDYQCLIHCLVDLCKTTFIKSIKSEDNYLQREILEWKDGNNSVIIFCGDLIHRKRFQDCVLDDECSDIFIIETLFRLKKTAKKYGGDIIMISGNHEIMNIIDPFDTTYTSQKNMEINKENFSSKEFINKYINNTYAWIKLNDILIAHGGLCSDYLKFLDTEDEFKKNKINNLNIIGGINVLSTNNIMIGGNLFEYGNDIIEFVNEQYRSFFTDYSKDKSKTNQIGFKLFIDYDFSNKCKHNMFWCREWGYSGINCDKFNKLVEKIGCNKMIIAHCPQFLSDDKSKMINFECEDVTDKIKTDIKKYKIARVDLGMSRSFEYNKSDQFIKFLSYNYNRKMAVLKLSWDENNKNLYFNYESIITEKLSCIQYLLIKYGITQKEWIEKKIYSDWLGFKYIDKIINYINNNNNNNKNLLQKCGEQNNSQDVILCLLYPIYFNKPNLNSVKQFLELK